MKWIHSLTQHMSLYVFQTALDRLHEQQVFVFFLMALSDEQVYGHSSSDDLTEYEINECDTVLSAILVILLYKLFFRIIFIFYVINSWTWDRRRLVFLCRHCIIFMSCVHNDKCILSLGFVWFFFFFCDTAFLLQRM